MIAMESVYKRRMEWSEIGSIIPINTISEQNYKTHSHINTIRTKPITHVLSNFQMLITVRNE